MLKNVNFCTVSASSGLRYLRVVTSQVERRLYILKGNTEIEHNIKTLTVEMVKRCVAAGCSNTHSDGVSLFHFPRDPSLRLQWTRQVQPNS